MAQSSDTSTAFRTGGDRLKAALDTFFAGLGQGFNAYLATRSRCEQIERLDALSDRQLAEMGLTRDDIPRHVFRDVFHL